MKTDDEILDIIEDAYRRTQLKPMTSGWVDVAKECACPMAVVCLAQEEPPYEFSYSFVEHAASVLYVPREWVRGFVRGFDGQEVPAYDCLDNPIVVADGHRLGRLVRQKYFG